MPSLPGWRRLGSGGAAVSESFHGNHRDLSGHRSGRLLAVRPIGRSNDGHVIWECQCDCGETAKVSSVNLARKKGTRSCGCLRRDVSSRSKNGSWNKDKTYALQNTDGQRVYKQKHSWTKAVLRI